MGGLASKDVLRYPFWKPFNPTIKADSTTLTGDVDAKCLVMGQMTFWTIDAHFNTGGGAGVISIDDLPTELVWAATVNTALDLQYTGAGKWFNQGVGFISIDLYLGGVGSGNGLWKMRAANDFADFTTTVGTSPADGLSAQGFVRTA